MYSLQRNYIENPLAIGEKPIKDDLIYLYIELNLNMSEIVNEYITNKSIDTIKRYLKHYNIHKPLSLIQQKIKQTNLKKYGVENTFQSEAIKQKIKQTNIEKYGVEYVQQLPTFKEKIKQTNLKKYGVEYVQQTPTFKEMVKHTNIEKYGVENPFQSEAIKQRIKQTNLEKYGKSFSHQQHISDETLEILHNKEKLIECFDNNNTTSRRIVADILGVSVSIIDKKLQKYGLSDIYITYNSTSSYEEDIYRNICSYYNGNIERNVRILDGKEIDIYLPDINLGIEFNGTYWHSENVLTMKNHDAKWYHYEKSKIATQHDIKLFHIFEYDYINKREKYLNFIRDYISPKHEITKETCYVKKLSNDEFSDFMEKYSININEHSDIMLGLYDEDILYEVISFRIKDDVYELINYGKKHGININGGLNMMFNHFVDLYKPLLIYGLSKNDNCSYNPFPILDFSLESIYEPESIHVGELCIYDCGKTYWKWGI